MPDSEIFEQNIDHDNPSFGTFKQRYWINTEFWKGPGSPVCISTNQSFYTDCVCGR